METSPGCFCVPQREEDLRLLESLNPAFVFVFHKRKTSWSDGIVHAYSDDNDSIITVLMNIHNISDNDEHSLRNRWLRPYTPET